MHPDAEKPEGMPTLMAVIAPDIRKLMNRAIRALNTVW